jgi:putative ABC transport system ATP-binding protein
VGPSGCGKTTLLSCIAGILDQTDGELTVLGQDLLELSGTQKARFRSENIGFVFQQFNLLPSLTAAENASIPLIVAGRRRSDALREAAEVLENLGLHDKRDSLPTQLSGGQQQRVAIARALVTQPKLIVCDEPTSALDAKTGHSIMELLREIAVQPGRSVVVVTHDPRVLEFADRIATMEDGRVLRVEEPGRMSPSEAIGLDLRRGSGQRGAASSEDE